MRLNRRQLKRLISEEYSRLKRRGLIREMAGRDPRTDIALKKGHGEGPATPEVAALIKDCFLNGGSEGKDYLVGYALEALEQAGYTVGKAGEVGELDVNIIVSFDEDAGTGMLYYPNHPKFEYSM